jgi:hypothetical protein
MVDEDSESGEVEESLELPVGTTGIVIKTLPNNYQAVISYGEVEKDKRVKFYEFETLEQENLPHGLWKPEKGDKIRFEENYDRALIVAKNLDHFLRISKMFRKEWVHPDIFTATLSTIGHKSPLKDDFHYFCREHSVGLLYIGLDDGVYEVDCLSLKEINLHSGDFKTDDIQKPMYSRVNEIDSNWFGEGINDIPDFEEYYRKLIK